MVRLRHAHEVYPDPLVEPTVGRSVVGLVGVDLHARHEFLHRAKGEGFKLSGVRGLPVGGIAIFRVGRPPRLPASREKHQVAPESSLCVGGHGFSSPICARILPMRSRSFASASLSNSCPVRLIISPPRYGRHSHRRAMAAFRSSSAVTHAILSGSWCFCSTDLKSEHLH